MNKRGRFTSKYRALAHERVSTPRIFYKPLLAIVQEYTIPQQCEHISCHSWTVCKQPIETMCQRIALVWGLNTALEVYSLAPIGKTIVTKEVVARQANVTAVIEAQRKRLAF